MLTSSRAMYYPTYTYCPKPKEIKVETFRINYLTRSPKVEKLGFEPVSIRTLNP